MIVDYELDEYNSQNHIGNAMFYNFWTENSSGCTDTEVIITNDDGSAVDTAMDVYKWSDYNWNFGSTEGPGSGITVGTFGVNVVGVYNLIVTEKFMADSRMLVRPLIFTIRECTPDWSSPTDIKDNYNYYIGGDVDVLVIEFPVSNGNCSFTSTLTHVVPT